MSNLEILYKMAIESVKLIALPYHEQKKCFEEFVDAPFEVLDVYHNTMVQLPKLVEEGKFSNCVLANLLRINNLIVFTSSNPMLKDLDEEQFSKSVEWNRIRELAKETLQLMGEKVERPNLKYI